MLLILPKATFHSLNTASADTGSFFSFPHFKLLHFSICEILENIFYYMHAFISLVDKWVWARFSDLRQQAWRLPTGMAVKKRAFSTIFSHNNQIDLSFSRPPLWTVDAAKQSLEKLCPITYLASYELITTSFLMFNRFKTIKNSNDRSLTRTTWCNL
jgi:hypothetical protein